MGKLETLRDISLYVDPTKFVQSLGDKISPKIFKIVQDLTSLAINLTRPIGYFRIEKIKEKKGGRILLDEEIELELNRISTAFRWCKHVVLFICTIGNRVEEPLNQFYKDGDPFRTYIFDRICSYLAEELAEQVQSRVASHFQGQDLKSTYRFSPGYCHWQISEQEKLFHFFPDIEVSLSNSYMMSPRKSVSAIFCLSEKPAHETNPCRFCADRECPWRRE